MTRLVRRGIGLVVTMLAASAFCAAQNPARIVVPNGGEVFSEGDIVPIVWTDVASTDKIVLDYSIDGGMSWKPIADTASGGVYLWRVPRISGSSCIVRSMPIKPTFKALRTIKLPADGGYANGSVFTSDGARVIVATTTSDIFVFNVADGAQVHRFRAHAGRIIRVDISADGSKIATASQDGTVKVWSTSDWSLIRTFSTGATSEDVDAYQARFSPDGTEIVVGFTDGGKIYVWNLLTGAERLNFAVSKTNFARGVDYSRDGQYLLAACSDSLGKVYAASDGHLVFTLNGHTKAVNSIRSSPDGTLIATGSFDGTARLWDSKTGAFIRGFLGHTGYVYSVKFDPSGKYVVTAGADRTVRVWNVADGSPLVVLTGHAGDVARAIFNESGTMISSVAIDSTVRLWERVAIPSDQSNQPFSVVACTTSSVGVSPGREGKEAIKAEEEDLR